MSLTQAAKVELLHELHRAPGAFVIPNPWDAGSARILASLGFKALATSSSAAAGTYGRRDYAMRREEALANAQLIAGATELPVTADMEDGYGRTPEAVAETVRLAINAGLAGCSIEDASGDSAPYEFTLAVERVRAAVTEAKRAPFPFMITARAENFTRDKADLADTITRLQAFEEAGADVLFAPGVPDLESIRKLCSSVTRPVNVVGTMAGGTLSVAQLADAGVKRISLAASLYRAALTGLVEAASEIKTRGTFSFAGRAITAGQQAQYFQ